jgi:hypothetical protein
MTLRQWSSSTVHYAQKLANSGLQGARVGRDLFLHGKLLRPYINESVRTALAPAALGACIGVIGSHPSSRHHSAAKALAYGVAGGALGFGVAVFWESRRLVASVASGAAKSMGRARDEHWLERHPIDYA